MPPKLTRSDRPLTAPIPRLQPSQPLPPFLAMLNSDKGQPKSEQFRRGYRPLQPDSEQSEGTSEREHSSSLSGSTSDPTDRRPTTASSKKKSTCLKAFTPKMCHFGNPIISDAPLTDGQTQRGPITSQIELNLIQEALWAIPRSTAAVGIIGPIIDIIQNYTGTKITEEKTAAILITMATTFSVSLTIQHAQVIAKNFSRDRHTKWDAFCFFFNETILIVQQTAVDASVMGFSYEITSGDDGAGNVSQWLMGAFLVLNLLSTVSITGRMLSKNNLKWIDKFLLKSRPIMEFLESAFDGAGLLLFIGYLALSEGLSFATFNAISPILVGSGGGLGALLGLFKLVGTPYAKAPVTLRERFYKIGIEAIAILRGATRDILITGLVLLLDKFCTGASTNSPAGIVLSILIGLGVGLEYLLSVLEIESVKRIALTDIEMGLLANEVRRNIDTLAPLSAASTNTAAPAPAEDTSASDADAATEQLLRPNM